MYEFLTFNKGRDCLKFLVNKFQIKEMYIPYYLCDVIRHTLFEESCKPIFYHIDDDFMPAVNFPAESYILYPNYFGIFAENIEKLALKYPKLIVDNAHAFYEKPSGFAGFNSGIKFGYINRAEVWFDNDSNSYIECSENEFESDKQRRKKSFVKLHKKYSTENGSSIAPVFIPVSISCNNHIPCTSSPFE